jgi:NADPH2:quinone reductase
VRHLAHDVVLLDPHDVEGTGRCIRALAPEGVTRIVEVALSANATLDAAVIANDGVIAAYASPADPTPIPFWTLLFANVTLRLLGSDDFPRQAKLEAAEELTRLAAAGALSVEVAEVLPLDAIAAAHTRVEQGGRGRVLLDTD